LSSGFDVPLDTKQVILEMFFLADVVTHCWKKNKSNTKSKQHRHV